MTDQETRAIRHMYRTEPQMFIQLAFRLLHPNDEYQHNWSIDAIGDALARCHRRETTRLIINMPPRSLKSVCASVALPAWVLGVQPDAKIMCVAGHRDLASDLHDLTMRLMGNPQYRALFPHARVRESKGRLVLPQGGFRTALTPSDALTGRGADMIIIDDPQSAHDADDPQKSAAIRNWYDQNIEQRLNRKHGGVVIVVMQRLAEDDLTGHLLNHGDWEVLKLPAIATEEKRLPESLGGRLVRRKGEPLHPDRENRAQLRKTLERVDAKVFMAQYQQEPYPINEGDTCHGVFHTAPHPDASIDECKYEGMWFGSVPLKTFLLDQLFGERTCIRRGTPPPMTTDEWIAWGESVAAPETELEPTKDGSVQPCNGSAQSPAPNRVEKFGVRCEPCSKKNIEDMSKRSRNSWR